MIQFRKPLACTAVAAALFGCHGPIEFGSETDNLSTGLRRAQSCTELVDLFRADAIAKLDRAIAERKSGRWGHPQPGVAEDVASDTAGTAEAGDGGAAPESTSAPEHSDTNTQVKGVDEADIVKTDGEVIWLLHQSELRTLQAYPPQSLAVTAAVEIEGYPVEMFVENGYAVVFSTTTVDVELPRFNGGNSGPGYGEPDIGMPEPMPAGDEGYYGGNSVKVTVLGLEGEEPKVLREFYTIGSYVSSRRHGDVVRVVVNEWAQNPYFHLPGDSGTFALQAFRSEMVASINRMGLRDWVAPRFEKAYGVMTLVEPDCGLYYAPETGSTGYGMTSVVTLNVAGEGPVTGPSVLGSSRVVYANASSLVVAHDEYSRGFWDEAHTTTVLHEFGLSDSMSTSYIGSGSVPGTLNNQFAIDEKDGVIRVASTVDDFQAGNTHGRVFTLKQREDGLEIVGDSGELAKQERIFSTRYVGDTAYVVTFEQTDPLFVVDLSDPEDVEILGELKIPGFSTYMHPLDDGFLLTAGRHRAEDGRRDDALSLQIFDVRDPISPKLSAKHVMNTEGYSVAESQHKAFNYYATKGLLAIPFESWGYSEYSSTLEVFRVTSLSGILPVGSIDHSAYLASDYSDYRYGNLMRRGVFIGDYLYSISAGAVLVHDLFNLSEAVAVLPLE